MDGHNGNHTVIDIFKAYSNYIVHNLKTDFKRSFVGIILFFSSCDIVRNFGSVFSCDFELRRVPKSPC